MIRRTGPSLRPPRARTNRLAAARAWVTRHRRAALAHRLRSACYGIGTGAIGLVFMWVEQRLWRLGRPPRPTLPTAR